jgi:nitrous oxide reductase accessory protein NosL
MNMEGKMKIRKSSAMLPLLAAILFGIIMALPAQGAGPTEPQTITEKTTCAVCGMYPHRYPAWQTQVIFTDNSMAAFDGGKCMFRFLLNMPAFTQDHKADQVAAVWVRDFAGGAWIDGKTASYVVGSSEMGPMGKELIPFASREAAEAFQKTKGGSVEPFAGITMETVKPLMGGMHHMQMPHGGKPHAMP